MGIIDSLFKKKPFLGAQSSPIYFVLEKMRLVLSFNFFFPLTGEGLKNCFYHGYQRGEF